MKNLVTSELDGAEVQILGRGVNLAASCMTAVPFASPFRSKSAKEGLWCDVQPQFCFGVAWRPWRRRGVEA